MKSNQAGLRASLWLAALMALMTGAMALADPIVNLPLTMDARFAGGIVLDPFFTDGSLPVVGQDMAADGSDTIVAGLVPITDHDQQRYIVTVARYGADGQRKSWTAPSSPTVDSSQQYLIVPYNQTPSFVRALAVRDIAVAPSGHIYVLLDSRSTDAGASVDVLLAVFDREGAYKGVTPVMTDPAHDDVGAAVLVVDDALLVVGSQPHTDDRPTGAKLVLARYLIDGDALLPDSAWAGGGRVERSLTRCSKVVRGSTVVSFNCDLQARRVLVSVEDDALYVGGDYFNAQAGGTASRDAFIMKLDPTTGDVDSSFGEAGVLAFGSTDYEEQLKGLILRHDPWNGDELVALKTYPRRCGHAINLLGFRTDTGALRDGSYIYGGSDQNGDGSCDITNNLEGSDMGLLSAASPADSHLVVVGRQTHGPNYSNGTAVFVLFDATDLHAAAQIVPVAAPGGRTENRESQFNAVIVDSGDGSHAADHFTMFGVHHNIDNGTFASKIVRVRLDRIFSDGFND